MTSPTAAFPASRTPTPIDRLLSLRIALSWELMLYLAIFAIAFALRTWDLGARALHHDESIHAQWSWRLAHGDYRHDPVFHGPFYYHVQGLVFFLFGASDYTSRLSAALFGSAMLALPLFLRSRLGAVGTLSAVALIAFSPTLVYYSRFFREDIYMAFFTLAMVVCMWRYVEDGRDRWLYGFAVALTCAITSKELTYVSAAIFLVFLDIAFITELAKQTFEDEEGDPTWPRLLFIVGMAPVGWVIAALWPFLGPAKESMRWRSFPRSGDLLVLLGTLMLPLLTPALKGQLEDAGLVEKGRLVCKAAMPQRDALAMGGLFAVSGSLAAFAGLQWRPKTWAIAVSISATIYLTLMTSFWTNLNGACTGPWGSLDYWMSQHGAVRGDQPWFYYYMLMPAYEFLPLLLCVAGAWWAVARGDGFSRFLAFWLVGMWVALSVAGEKMPWLNTHLALPACILAAWTINRAWRSWTDAPPLSRTWGSLASVAVIGAGGLAVIAFLPGGALFHAIRAAVAVISVGGVVYAAKPLGRSSAATVAVVAVVGALSLFSIRTMVTSSFVRGDVPEDLLVYTQSSPYIPRIKSDIDQLAEATGKGHNLRIAVDSQDSFAWPWAWYLRNYTQVSYVDFTNGPPAGDFDVLLANDANLRLTQERLAASAAPKFGTPERYPHRWWFDETYKYGFVTAPGQPCLASGGNCGLWTNSWLGGVVPNFVPNVEAWKLIGTGIFRGEWLDTWALYWRDHKPLTTANDRFERCYSCGSIDGWAFFPANFDRATGMISAKPIEPPKPTVDGAGRPSFGGLGSLPGQFSSPVDVAVDAQGNLYVIDSTSKKLQKFDASGNFIAATDIRRNPADGSEQAEPWGLTVAPDGRVIVADTFGWRIRIFDSELKDTGVTFGQPPDTSKTPGPFDLFGPRDAIVDAQGQLWVTDTGNDRIVIYTLKGEFVRAFGVQGAESGQFNEPVGLARGTDGKVYVADMYNRRVVVLGADGGFVNSFPVEGWGGQDAIDKPYLATLRDGRVAVSLPSLNQVRVYTATGALAGTIAPADEPLNRPYGLVETADGKLWISEGGSARLRRFDIP